MSVPAREALKMIAKNAANPKFKLIDVRTLPERNLQYIPNSQHIPLDQLSQQISVFDKQNTYLIYCRSGKRSQTATNLLKSQGISAINMEGGILQWQELTSSDGNKQQKKEESSEGRCNLI